MNLSEGAKNFMVTNWGIWNPLKTPFARAYLDTNFWVYLLNPPSELEANLAIISELISGFKLIPITSVLSWSECLVKPLEQNDFVAKEEFDQIFTQTAGLELIEITRKVMFLAAEIRAQTKIKMPDAIHLASAKIANCDVFITHDRDLRKESLKSIMNPMLLQGLL